MGGRDTLSPMLQYIPHLLGLGAPALALLGSIVVTLTAFHVFLLAVGKVVPPASKVGHVIGVAAIDVGKATDLVKALIAFFGKFGRGIAAGGLIALVCCLGCSPADLAAGAGAASAVLTTAEAFVTGIMHVLDWLKTRGVDPQTVKDAYAAAQDKDYGMAVAIASELVSKARAAGDPIPEYVETELRMAEGLLASKAVEQGMRALSTGGGPSK